MPRDVTFGLEGSHPALQLLLARDAASYIDVVVSAERPAGAGRWWQLAGTLTEASGQHAMAGAAERSVWQAPEDAAVFARAVAELSRAAGEEVDVQAPRPLRVDEIVARHQAAAARQRGAIQTQISSGTMTLVFEAPAFAAPMTINAETVIYRDATRTDIEQRAVKVNGLDVGSGIPRLPLIEPERVTSPPLAIELTDAYRYSLQGTDTIGGTPCYLVAFEPVRSGESLFRGRAWIGMDDFALVKVAAVQTNLRGPIVTSEQTDEFARSATGVVAPQPVTSQPGLRRRRAPYAHRACGVARSPRGESSRFRGTARCRARVESRHAARHAGGLPVSRRTSGESA